MKFEKWKIQWPEKITVAHLNVNLIRNKFDALFFFIDTKIDILLISETKLNDSFASAQFRLKGFCTPYRLDRNSKGAEFYQTLMKYSIKVSNGSTCNIETISVEINLNKKKLLLIYCGLST